MCGLLASPSVCLKKKSPIQSRHGTDPVYSRIQSRIQDFDCWTLYLSLHHHITSSSPCFSPPSKSQPFFFSSPPLPLMLPSQLNPPPSTRHLLPSPFAPSPTSTTTFDASSCHTAQHHPPPPTSTLVRVMAVHQPWPIHQLSRPMPMLTLTCPSQVSRRARGTMFGVLLRPVASSPMCSTCTPLVSLLR